MSEQIDGPSDSVIGKQSPGVVVRRIEIDGKIIWQVIGAVLVTLVLLWALDQASSIVAMVAIAFSWPTVKCPTSQTKSSQARRWRSGPAPTLPPRRRRTLNPPEEAIPTTEEIGRTPRT